MPVPSYIMYVPDQYKTKEIHNIVILENGGMLRLILDCYKNQKICDKNADMYFYALEFVIDCCETPKYTIKLLILILLQYNLSLNDRRFEKCVLKLLIFTLTQSIYSWMIGETGDVLHSYWNLSFCYQFIPKWYKTQKLFGKAFVFDSVSDQFKTQETCNKVFSKEKFMLKHCLDRFKTQEMCGKLLPTLKCIPDGFVTNKMLKKTWWCMIQTLILLHSLAIIWTLLLYRL